MSKSLDVFSMHKAIIEDYKHFVNSFINIKNPKIKAIVDAGMTGGKFWPDPLIQFNPSFEFSDTAQSLCDEGVTHLDIAKIFKGYKLFKHQVEAIKKGCEGNDFVVTSGTGSGKSLTYLSTIFDYLLKNKGSQGIKAIIVYPMNALINSQHEEIVKFKNNYEKESNKPFPITFAQYTGQEKQEERTKVKEELPDIILTNYMMLELILTRTWESSIRSSMFSCLKFLVFDELHTYCGRRGSDVSILIRRIQSQCKQDVTCIGTSATMISGGTIPEQKNKVAEVATKIFGKKFKKDQIISEYLARCFDYTGSIPGKDLLMKSLNLDIDINGSEALLKSSPLSVWLENTIAIEETDNILLRRKPRSFNSIVKKLSEDSGIDEKQCESQLVKFLQWLSNVNTSLEEKVYTYLPFKIHQFISQTGTVYVSLHNNDDQLITLDPTNHKIIEDKKIPLFPVVFSRISGHEFLCVSKDLNEEKLKPRGFREVIDDEEENITAGYIIPGDDVWDPEKDFGLLPDGWGNIDKNEKFKPVKQYKDRLPQKIYYNAEGHFSYTEKLDFEAWFMPVKLLFDPTSGTFFDLKTSEGTKLTRLGSEGRSTSTTILSISVLKQLDKFKLSRENQKLLSFTDNRQDAALQAGHFNDFIKVTQLRSALYHALNKNNQLDHTNLSRAVFDSLDLAIDEFSAHQATFPAVIRETEAVFQDYLMYRALYDLKRGWRVVLPNLEQCALLEIEYKNLKENCDQDDAWKEIPFLGQATSALRQEIIYQVLDYFRKSYALYSNEYLTGGALEGKSKAIKEKLKDPWKFNENERINDPSFMRYETLAPARRRIFTASIGATSALGKYLRTEAKNLGIELKSKNYRDFIEKFLKILGDAGWLTSIDWRNDKNEVTKLWQLRIDQVIWKLGDGNAIKEDYVKTRSYKNIERKPNSFFQALYKTNFKEIKSLIGKEHTGQLTNEDRQDREIKFRTGEYSALFCSPTMELGIDIANLNIVHLRNIPPNPANYAQRSGRAGRSGQAALIFASCSSYSPHDRHYFKHSTNMVSGNVAPPKIDLSNKELLETHLHALYMAKTNSDEINQSLMDLIDDCDLDALKLKESIKEKIRLSISERAEIKSIFKQAIADISKDLERELWFNDEWIDIVINKTPEAFDRSLDRWRKLYRLAQNQINEATDNIRSGLYTQDSQESRDLHRSLKQGERQRDLLTNSNKMSLSEFYPYRYFASEGFFPGYNFTRLPIRTYIPIGDAGEYISRPRFVALREFGPQNVIYHNGAKYKIEQLLAQEIDKNLQKAKVSKTSGYILMGKEYDFEVCPFNSKVLLNSDTTKEIFTDLIEMTTTRTVETDRIQCEEEERLSRGYDIDTYFSAPSGLENIKTAVVKNDEAAFLNIRFIPSARLVQINKKWKGTKEEGFLMGLKSGRWKSKKQSLIPSTEENKKVKLFTTDTADALYIEPIKSLALDSDGVITLQYALKRAIENVFQIESNEIGATQMGDEEEPNIFLYEASEGSLGILSQFIEDKDTFQSVIKEAYKLCRFDEEAYKDEASYDDLLSYYNQRDHEVINRFTIKDALEKLMVCRVEIATSSGKSYADQYNYLLSNIDQNSSTEVKLLNYLYENGYRLPDKAQKQLSGIYCKPDFFYEPDVWVFCDGTPHDKLEIRETDEAQRNAIRNRGDQVIVYYYKDNLDDLIKNRADIFKKVK
ncbi:MAG: DEAD/DEAH box helicase [Candidatus Omnitrophica bacterium]|nr:DEAD/DEAH box helicase [Candidatus Omnitrophota bacterium]